MSFTVYVLLNLVGAWFVSEFEGKQRELGYKSSLILSLLFSPLFGYILTLSSPKLPFAVN